MTSQAYYGINYLDNIIKNDSFANVLNDSQEGTTLGLQDGGTRNRNANNSLSIVSGIIKIQTERNYQHFCWALRL